MITGNQYTDKELIQKLTTHCIDDILGFRIMRNTYIKEDSETFEEFQERAFNNYNEQSYYAVQCIYR